VEPIQDNAVLLNTKEVEAAQATEAAQKLQALLEETQVAAQNKDNEIVRLQAEVVNAQERELILEGKLLELNFLVKEKNKEIQKNAEEIDRTRAEAVSAKEQVRILEGKILEINSLASKEIGEIQKNVEEM
jgi:predicted  nucleic acid-binding Zn-ribbon protein